MRLSRDQIIELIAASGFNTEKNSAMVDVFDRFAQLVVEKLQQQKPVSTPTITIQKGNK